MDGQYPINTFCKVFNERVSKNNKTISDLTYSYAWPNVIEELKNSPDMVNTCRYPKNNSETAKLYTPLHQAANGRARKEVFEELLKLGASKTLKTEKGETAYDIAKRLGMSEDILKLIEVPEEVIKNQEEIQKMEKGLHEVIKGRVGELITKNGQSLPQLAYLYEFGQFYYPVPGMYGGFSVSKHEKGIQSESWIRVCGGSGERHVVDRSGNVTLEEEGFC